MKFSLITGTYGRTQELQRLLDSLAAQTEKDFEFFIVDQNTELDLAPLIQPYQSILTIHHIKTSQRGLSRARNLVLPQAQGEIIAFPDDDCWYPEKLLEQISRWFEAHPEADGLLTRLVDLADPEGTDFLGRLRREATQDGAPKAMRSLCDNERFTPPNSNVIFFRSRLVRSIGPFNESIGPGASSFLPGGEDIDYIIRAYNLNSHIYYEPFFEMYHPKDPLQFDSKFVGYGRSWGYVCSSAGVCGFWIGFLRPLLALLGGHLITWVKLGIEGNYGKSKYIVLHNFFSIQGYLLGRFSKYWDSTKH